MEPRRSISSPVKPNQNADFDSTYKTLISRFKAGDLIFGLRDVRARALEELDKFRFTGCFANALNDKTVTLVLNNGDPTQLKLLQRQHFTFLSAHRNKLLRPHGKPIPALAHKGDQRSAAYRRACKLLLVDDGTERTWTVHVLTENMDWLRICSKEYKDTLGITHTDDSVTSSEIRAAYRYFKTHGKNHPNILFYDARVKLLNQLPWEQPALMPFFREYDRQHQLKIDYEEASTQSQPENDLVEEAKLDTSPRLP
jgi:hypothetical protein